MIARTVSAARRFAAAGSKPNEPFGRRFHHMTGAEIVSKTTALQPPSMT